MKLFDSKVHGVKKFRLEEVSLEIKEMRASCKIVFDLIQLKGNYSLTSLFGSAKGLSEFQKC
jgi:hypothetical protein